jgi:hypothetical protein
MAMKLCFKMIVGILGWVSIACSLLAADSTTTYPTYTPRTPASQNYSVPNSTATSSSNAVMVALNAQALLLKELIKTHQKRSEELTEKTQAERAKWETELVKELQEKSVSLQKSIDQAVQPTDDRKSGAEVDDQLAFLSIVDANLERVGKEISAAIEDTRVLAVQISTNKVPEDIAGMSSVLSENQRLVRELQREQLDLELRKLQFRAIRKVIEN